jgi:4-amino-4-deoxy-L-arabinose transferase-like glycosyltransferase
VFWSVCKTKLPHYLLPAYPALALLTACFIERWLSDPASIGRWALRNAWISTILVGVGLMIAIHFVAAKYLPGEQSLGRLGLLLVLGGGWCWWKTWHRQPEEAAITFAITSVAFLTAVFGFAALRVDRFQNAKPMMAAICADENKILTASSSLAPSSPIATYDFFRESTVFYGGKPVTKCDDDTPGRTAQQALAEFLAKPGRSYVITTDEYEPQIAKAFPGQLKVIHREPRFLADGEMVVFRHGE